MRSTQRPLPIKAKARLCVQGQNDPDCATGQVKTDAPTVQRISTVLFLHAVVCFGWCDTLRCGDVSNAFLQGNSSEGEALCMYSPKQGLPGVTPGCLLKLKKPVYGRPDAPRAWFDVFSGVLVNEHGFVQSKLDPALFIRRDSKNDVCALAVIHVEILFQLCTDAFRLENGTLSSRSLRA